MEGLNSIALAAAKLEEELSQSLQSRDNHDQPAVTSSDDSTPTETTQASKKLLPLLPEKKGFGIGPPRLVSSNSMGSVDQTRGSSTATPPIPSSPEIKVVTPSSGGQVQRPELPLLQGSVPEGPSPTEVITEVMEHDVLCGRGGETNHHSGNIKYRQLVKQYQPLYIQAKRGQKPRIAHTIVHLVRRNGGRFIKRTEEGTWRDVGNTKAREKTSQALREGAPELRGSSSNGETATSKSKSKSKSALLKREDRRGSDSSSSSSTNVSDFATNQNEEMGLQYQALASEHLQASGFESSAHNSFLQSTMTPHTSLSALPLARLSPLESALILSATAANPALAALLLGQKRPYNAISTLPPNAATSSSSMPPQAPGTNMQGNSTGTTSNKRSRGPRLKRFKDRISTEANSSDEDD